VSEARVWVAACREDELADGGAISLPLHPPVGVFRIGGAFYAIDDLCSHGEYLLSEGYVEPDCTVECIGHGALFSLSDGRALTLPATEDVQAHPTRVVDGVVEVEVDQTRVR
jgi:3-phenylpropionate/trans-cinnamate dioxygenase ferredoxin component